jgi:hypothetical protein
MSELMDVEGLIEDLEVRLLKSPDRCLEDALFTIRTLAAELELCRDGRHHHAVAMDVLLERAEAERDALRAAARSAVAALSQKMVFPADVDLAIKNLTEALADRVPDHERRYPCAKCGKLRTEAEGGTTFDVCDTCYDALPFRQPSEGRRGPLPADWVGAMPDLPEPDET